MNVTNDGWFRESARPPQHFDNAIFHCIEFRRPMVRAANTARERLRR
jgi:apolipoprotein N-acyltransferase